MTVLITRTKIIIPRRRKDLFSRQRLLDRLYHSLDYKLFLVIAPAGYGKTTLLVDFAYQSQLPVCWYSLDTLDQDLMRFLTHFIASVQNSFPSFGNRSLAALTAANPANLDQLVAIIVNDAYEHINEHFLLILDDYHLVSDQNEIVSFLNRFVREIAENCHLVLASRTLVTLPDLSLLVARAQVGGIGFDDLAFRAEEIQALVLQNYHLPIPDLAAKELEQVTEGWVTGLLLTAQTMWLGMTERLQAARVAGVNLYDYLAQQVLNQQPPPLRDFMLRTSFLEEFDAGLCRAVFGENRNWPAFIATILQNNLFVIPVGKDGKSLRYHHLLRDFLQARFEEENPDQVEGLLQSITAAYIHKNEWEKAHAICARLNDSTAMADLIEQAGTPMIRNVQHKSLADWIDSLPKEVQTARPALLSLRGTLFFIQGQGELGLNLLNRAEAMLRQGGDYPSLARTLARRAFVYRFTGRYPEAIRDGLEALSLTEQHPEMVSVRAEALRVIGFASYYLGNLDRALEQLEKSLALYEELNERQNIAMVHLELGMCYRATGRFHESQNQYQLALGYWRKSNDETNQAAVLNNLGVLHHAIGNYEQAAKSFKEALVCARNIKVNRQEALILCSIGDLYATLEANSAALDAYRKCREIALRVNEPFLLAYEALAEVRVYRKMGELSMARECLQRAEELILARHSDYELALWKLEAGQLLMVEGKAVDALALLQPAAQFFAGDGRKNDAATANLFVATAYHANGDLPSACAALREAFRWSDSLEDQSALVIAGRGAKKLLEAAQIDPAVARAAANLLEKIVKLEADFPALYRRLRPYALSDVMTPPKLSINAFGRAKVAIDGKPVTLKEWINQKRVRELFIYFLTHRERHTKEEIGVVLWPESPPAQLNLQFKNALYRLRFALGQGVIACEEERYYFNDRLDYAYDVEEFELHLAHSRAVVASEKIQALQKAVGLYRGPFFSEEETLWVLTERQRLGQRYLESLLELARLFLDARQPEAALNACQQALQEDECLEEAYRLAMSASALMGNRAAIIQQYERCRLTLSREFHVSPSHQTEQLYGSLIR